MTDNRMELYNPLRSSSLDFCNGYNKAVYKANDIIELLDIKNTQLAEFLAEAEKKNEALISAQETLQKYIKSKDAEIERLQSIVNMDLMFVGVRGGKSERAKQIIRIRMNEVRAEAIKEFAERLKANITINNTEDGYLIYSVDYNCLMSDIDDLVKEIVGEDE